MGRYEELEELMKRAIDAKIKKKYYTDEYNKLRNTIRTLMENEFYITEYHSEKGAVARISITKRKQLNMDKIRELLEIAKEAGYDIKEEDLYTVQKIKRFEIDTPDDITRKRRFAKGAKK